MVDNYNYSMVRIVCKGKIKVCDFCKDKKEIQEGYCKMCGRPLWKKSGEDCNFIIGYKDKNYHQQNKVHIKCKYCNSITSI